jgi:hypothetical protein
MKDNTVVIRNEGLGAAPCFGIVLEWAQGVGRALRLGPFETAETTINGLAEAISKCWEEGGRISQAFRSRELGNICMHQEGVRFTAIREGLKSTNIFEDTVEEGAVRLVTRIITTIVFARESCQKFGSCTDVVADCGELELLTVNIVARGEVVGVHSQLELATAQIGTLVLQEEVVSPLHICGKLEIMECAGTIRPSSFGITGGACTGGENRLEESSCSRSGLGRK